MIKTKTVATLGPASSDDNVLAAMIDAGMDVARFNFSHGRHEDHEDRLTRLRRLAHERGRVITIVGDLCGPKIRLQNIPDEGIKLNVGDEVTFAASTEENTPGAIETTFPGFIHEISVGHRLFIADGTIRLRVTEKTEHGLKCKCEVAGTLKEGKGVNLPDTEIRSPALTDQDRVDLRWAVAHDVDYIALSFVQRRSDIDELRSLIDSLGGGQQIIAKVETPAAIRSIDDIIDAADAVLVARGDLGVEMELAKVPILQKDLARRCRRAAKPVIIATEMLQSMVESPTPTRAEVSDVANAVLDHTDAVMLSAETAIGAYPVEALRVMNEIIREAEHYEADGRGGESAGPYGSGEAGGRVRPGRYGRIRDDEPIADKLVTAAVARCAALVAEELQPRAIVIWTRVGNTARFISRYRPDAPVIALTPDEAIARRVNLYYGITALATDRPTDETARRGIVDRALLDHGWADRGDTVIIVSGRSTSAAALTNAIVVHRVGEEGA